MATLRTGPDGKLDYPGIVEAFDYWSPNSTSTPRVKSCCLSKILAQNGDAIRIEVERLKRLTDKRSEKILLTTKAALLERIIAIIEADRNVLSQLRRGACRYCWGQDGLYQRTRGEFDKARKDNEWHNQKQSYLDKPILIEFDPQGGIGFNPNISPNPECTECFGDGDMYPFFPDSRTEGASLIFSGVKQTKDGIEVKGHDFQWAVDMLSKLEGHIVTRTQEVPPNLDVLSDEDLEAYERICRKLANQP